MIPTTHNVGGWTLEDMDWNPVTGIAVFLYSHPKLGSTTVERPQPSLATHRGWHDREREN